MAYLSPIVANPAPLTEQLTPFTSETGKQARVKSVRVLRELVENGKKHLALTAEHIAGHSQTSFEVIRQIELIEVQLTHAHEELSDAGLSAKDRAALMRECRGHMEHLCRLRGIGEPARVRPVNQPASIRQVRSEPIQIDGGPVQSVAIQSQPQPDSTQEPKPQGWEYGL